MAINRIDHAVVRVDDLVESRRYYIDGLGLTELESGRDISFLSCDGKNVDLVLRSGGTGLHSLAIGIDGGAEFERIERNFTDRGIEYALDKASPLPGMESVIEHRLPTGQLVQVILGKSGATGLTNKTWDNTSISPIDMDHVTLAATDVEHTALNFTDLLPYQLTEVIRQEKDWMAAFIRTSTLHHDIGFVASSNSSDTLHHFAFWVDGIRHQQLLADRLLEHGYHIEFGPGRHGGPGKQLYMYALDPSGNRIEFCGQMAEVVSESVYFYGADEIYGLINAWTPENVPETFFGHSS